MVIETTDETVKTSVSSVMETGSEFFCDLKHAFSEIYLPRELGREGVLGKAFHWTIGAHFKLFLHLSIPPFSASTWNYFLATVFPTFSLSLTLLRAQITTLRVWEVALAASLVLSLALYNTSCALGPPRYLPLLMLVAFLQSVQWMWFLCGVTVEAFKLLVEVFAIQPAYMGITFMAAANSIGDIISNLTMGNLGYNVTALTASFAGPIFNLMVGMGITMTRNIVKSGVPLRFSLKDALSLNGNMLILTTIITQGIFLTVLIVVLSKNG
eukprot:TRINITY_DN6373_c0_g1_i3.p1 TRINITY_DN6373_c0_g1~~TRINITY_DN6373_c0_g1_i3.p1  ORF type:complete len:269 (+),score=47.59 TRINITY_DN6373_c0_g1_i3:1011-1817(+)